MIYLYVADRLWVQRSAHKPKSLKRKRLPIPKQPVSKDTHKLSGKRRKVVQEDSSDSPGNVSDPQPREFAASGPRAAKLKANRKLDAQAKAFAEFQRENAITTRPARTFRRGGPDNKSTEASPFQPPHGTRISGRLRRVKPDQDEDWESVPDESLTEDNSEPPPRRSTRATRLRRKSPEVTDSESDQEDQKLIKTGLEYDESVSDLTDLSSEHGDDPCGDHVSAEDNDGDRGKCNGEIPMERKQSDVNPDNIPEEFIEWEMV